MELLTVILSSAVISALISYFANAKNNQLKYVTSERSEWRKEIKNIMSALMKCDKYDDKAKKLLTDLKLRINFYGMKKEYPHDICLNYFRDEHIWKEILAIEQGEDFKHHREILVEYVGLSLKFDWERSKHETKSAKKYVVILVYLMVMVLTAIFDYVYIKQNDLKSIYDALLSEMPLILTHTFSLLFFLAPSLPRYIGVVKAEENYNRFAGKFIYFMLGILTEIMCTLVIGAKSPIILGCMGIEMILGVLLFAVMLFSDSYLRDYNNAVRACV